MEEIKANLVLKFNENQLLKVRKVLGYGEINKLEQDIEQLRDWTKKQSHFSVKKFDDEFLERLLIYNKGSIERTKQKLDKLCTCISLMPDFLKNVDPRNEFRAVHVVTNNYVLPKPTEDNYRVMISTVTGEEDKDFELISRYIILLLHYMLRNDYCLGYEWIGDIRNITFGVVKKLNPIVIHKALTLVTEAMGQRMKKIHFLSGSKFFDSALSLFKQGMTAKLRQRIIIHDSVESLYKHIPKANFPIDLGGDEESSLQISEHIFNELSSDNHVAYMKFMETIGTDECKRLVSEFNKDVLGLPGSFKKLCVD